MKKIIALALAFIGVAAASTASVACALLWFDEPCMPKKLIER